ncbi:MAG TPA: hypothetical protein DIW23_03420 [Anaerolineae bacterium]|nr:hypothetical protein [Anaerolineae bacterium]HRJ75597.1 hypothetical protein [Anaerolineales bacterium]
MQISEAQKEVRTVYMGAFVGFIVTGVIWAISAALGTWNSKNLSIMALILGGTFIFPLTQLLLKIMGKPITLRKENPFSMLAMQIAFTIPATYPLIAAAASNNINWFFPSFLVVVGAHYLPFIFLYGMWQFLIVAVALVAFGTGIGFYFPDSFTLGGWVGTAVYLLAAFPFRAFAQKQ